MPYEKLHPGCGDLYGEDLHAFSGRDHKWHVDLDLQNPAILAECVQQEVKEEDKKKACQCIHKQQTLYKTSSSTKSAQCKV